MQKDNLNKFGFMAFTFTYFMTSNQQNKFFQPLKQYKTDLAFSLKFERTNINRLIGLTTWNEQ